MRNRLLKCHVPISKARPNMLVETVFGISIKDRGTHDSRADPYAINIDLGGSRMRGSRWL